MSYHESKFILTKSVSNWLIKLQYLELMVITSICTLCACIIYLDGTQYTSVTYHVPHLERNVMTINMGSYGSSNFKKECKCIFDIIK